MRLPVLIAALIYGHLILALVTFETIRSLTTLSDEGREKIVKADDGNVLRTGDVRTNMKGGQVVLGSSRAEDGEEIEVTITAVLRFLCSDLLSELEKPIKNLPSPEKSQCVIVILEYHKFVAATVKLLREVQERQQVWRWRRDSPAFEAVAWLQALWASRSTNIQNRSFIEQQMILYEYRQPNSCFGKEKEVLRRGVEIVEYLNDLMEGFE